jgi:hypothetical protein
VRHDDAAARLADEAAHALGLHSIVCQPARAVTPRMATRSTLGSDILHGKPLGRAARTLPGTPRL